MYVTPYADVNDVLQTLRTRIRQCLGENLLGLYLHGSLVTGDFAPGISDVDLLAVSAKDLDAAEFAALQHLHVDLLRKWPAWENRIEVAYASVAALQSFQSEQKHFAIVSPGEPFQMKIMDNGYLINWYVVRERGVALMGPHPAAVIPPIAKAEFRLAVRSYLSWLAERLPEVTDSLYLSYAVLTACRALYLHRKGELASKEHAAAWAQEELEEWSGLIDTALAARRAWRDEQTDHAVDRTSALQFVAVVKACTLT